VTKTLPTIELAWIRRDGHLVHMDADVERILGRTAEECKKLAMQDVMTPSSYEKMKQTYLTGPPGKIAHRALTVEFYHRDGHIVTAHLSVVCHWDENGLVEAWGSARYGPHQKEQDALLAWWPMAEPEDLESVIHTAGIYAAL
jgi:PAS domain S-box-containing protein